MIAYELAMVWPGANCAWATDNLNMNVWSQSNDPFNTGAVTGFQAISLSLPDLGVPGDATPSAAFTGLISGVGAADGGTTECFLRGQGTDHSPCLGATGGYFTDQLAGPSCDVDEVRFYVWTGDGSGDADCEYGQWSPWSPCCDGEQIRTRVAIRPGHGSGAACSDGELVESQECDSREENLCVQYEEEKGVLVFRQTCDDTQDGWRWVRGQLERNKHDPTADNYAILDRIDDLARIDTGKFEFTLNWPQLPINCAAGFNYNKWIQDQNPLNTPAGSTPGTLEDIQITFTDNFDGLELSSDGSEAVFDGNSQSRNEGFWFYAVGAMSTWGTTGDGECIPGPECGDNWVRVAELWVQPGCNLADGTSCTECVTQESPFGCAWRPDTSQCVPVGSLPATLSTRAECIGGPVLGDVTSFFADNALVISTLAGVAIVSAAVGMGISRRSARGQAPSPIDLKSVSEDPPSIPVGGRASYTDITVVGADYVREPVAASNPVPSKVGKERRRSSNKARKASTDGAMGARKISHSSSGGRKRSTGGRKRSHSHQHKRRRSSGGDAPRTRGHSASKDKDRKKDKSNKRLSIASGNKRLSMVSAGSSGSGAVSTGSAATSTGSGPGMSAVQVTPITQFMPSSDGSSTVFSIHSSQAPHIPTMRLSSRTSASGRSKASTTTNLPPM